MGLRVREREGRITSAKVRVGALHRGLEGLCEARTFEGVMPLMARGAVRSSVHWQVAYAEAVEGLAGVEVPPRGRAVRVALMELERIADHMLAHACLLDVIGCPAASARVWSDRELVMDSTQVVTGQRLVQDAISIGGVVFDAPEAWSRRLQDVARMVQGAVHEYVRTVGALAPFDRLEGLVPVHPEDMRGWGLSGPLVRAAGVATDARVDGRCRSYEGIDVHVVTRRTGDALARAEVRLLEMSASAKALNRLARTMPGGRARSSTPEVVPKGSSLGLVEGPRGLVACHVVSDGTGGPRRVRVASPDLAHASSLDHLLLGCPTVDAPLAVASIDICVGGIDR
jgi:NADH-quinone oxidoreductase subunit D